MKYGTMSGLEFRNYFKSSSFKDQQLITFRVLVNKNYSALNDIIDLGFDINVSTILQFKKRLSNNLVYYENLGISLTKYANCQSDQIKKEIKLILRYWLQIIS
ncbi:MAG: hypothetical protein AB8U25_00855 [Rickettsiales endosymbiont of Dermacentor nuttalli]